MLRALIKTETLVQYYYPCQAVCHEEEWEMKVLLHVFLTSALIGSEWSIPAPAALPPDISTQ